MATSILKLGYCPCCRSSFILTEPIWYCPKCDYIFSLPIKP